MVKPRDLKSPYRGQEEWLACLQPGILFAPRAKSVVEDPFVMPPWSHEALFGNELPVVVEYCSGNGGWIAQQAAADPSRNWVAVEMLFDRARKIWSKRENRALSNLFIVCGEALDVTQRYFSSHAISQLFINFPDPWPKRRHADKRLLRPVFLREMRRILAADSPVTFVTDDPDYSLATIQLFLEEGSGFASALPAPHYQPLEEGYGSSFFEELWRDKGRENRYHQFMKKAEGSP